MLEQLVSKGIIMVIAGVLLVRGNEERFLTAFILSH